LNGITSIPKKKSIKTYQEVQKLTVGDTQTGNFISLLSFFGKYTKNKSYRHVNWVTVCGMDSPSSGWALVADYASWSWVEMKRERQSP
jgi:hypothetical protein